MFPARRTVGGRCSVKGVRREGGTSAGPSVDFPCPNCGAKAGARGEPEFAVFHALPPCATFEKVSAMEFVRLARLANGRFS
jgi:hypothetical protein